MSPGDQVALWASGPTGGLMALGELTSPPYSGPDFTHPEKPGHWVNWDLAEIVNPPIPRRQMEKVPILSTMQPIAPVHMGSNFRVTPEQWEGIMDLIGENDGEDSIALTIPELFGDRANADLEVLADVTNIPLQEWVEIDISNPSQKKQIIFEGPPGSGKTYVARLFARYLAGVPLDATTDEHVEIVQFHQSYGYEDFVAGIRPVTGRERATDLSEPARDLSWRCANGRRRGRTRRSC